MFCLEPCQYPALLDLVILLYYTYDRYRITCGLLNISALVKPRIVLIFKFVRNALDKYWRCRIDPFIVQRVRTSLNRLMKHNSHSFVIISLISS